MGTLSEMNEIVALVRNIIREALSAPEMALTPTVAPAMAQGRTFDQEGFRAFMKQSGLFGHEEDILSIIEGRPTKDVINDINEFVAFHKSGEDVAQMSAEVMLDHYLSWNHLNVDKNKVLAFSISEA